VLLTCWKTPPLPAQLPPNLRYVCHLAGSVKKLVAREHVVAGLLVSNWGGSISRIVAEWALFHILSCLRRATHWTLVMHREGGWKNGSTETASLYGRRVGLHGFGLVSRELLKLLAPFGCTVSAFAPDVDAATEARYGIRRAASMEDLFATTTSSSSSPRSSPRPPAASRSSICASSRPAASLSTSAAAPSWTSRASCASHRKVASTWASTSLRLNRCRSTPACAAWPMSR